MFENMSLGQTGNKCFNPDFDLSICSSEVKYLEQNVSYSISFIWG